MKLLKVDNMVESYPLNYPTEYTNHDLFLEIEKMQDFYDSISYSCYQFCPAGTRAMLNYASYVYTAIQGTLDSIKTLLKIGRINDAYALVRKYFDVVLVEIYIDVIRKDQYDWEDNVIVKDVDEWLRGKHRMPSLKKLLGSLEKSGSTKDIYPFFGWNTYFKHNREILDDSVHGNRYNSIILNCNKIAICNREKHLDNILIVLKQVFTMHLAFILHLNPHYLMASDYVDHLDLRMIPPEGSETWITSYAQEAFDRYIKPIPRLSAFIRKTCGMKIN